MAAKIGFLPFFIIAACAALPGIVLLLVILRFYPPANRRVIPAQSP
jgi:hypothetical protein